MLAGFALELVEKFPMFASKKDDVLVAIARTFPSELDHWETLVYPPSMFLMYYKHFHLLIFFFYLVLTSMLRIIDYGSLF